jgi:hypothetical protein
MVHHYPAHVTHHALDSEDYMKMSTNMQQSDIPCQHSRTLTLSGSMKNSLTLSGSM